MMVTKTKKKRVVDIFINHQKLRHGRLAYLVRKSVYSLCIDKRSWPLVFKAPGPGELPEGKSSAHLYIHIPFCKTICPHCPYNKVLFDSSVSKKYGKALINELQEYLNCANPVPVDSLYIGGGTPTIDMGLVERVVKLLKPLFNGTPEVAIEVNPADASLKLLERIKVAGINKVSLGIETFNSGLLRQLQRRYTPAQAEQAVINTRQSGFECVDINLIYGIPGQNPDDALKDAKKCIDLRVDQISAYPLFALNHTDLGKQLLQQDRATYGEWTKLRVQKGISALCRKSGYSRTSVWSYTRAGIKPYTTVTRMSYRGFGAGAGSKIDGIFWFNTFSVDAYSSLSENVPALVLLANEKFRRFHWLYWQIYCTVINTKEYKELFNRDVMKDFRIIFLLLRLLPIAGKRGDKWYLNEFGVGVSHSLQALFSLAYIEKIWKICKTNAWPEKITVA